MEIYILVDKDGASYMADIWTRKGNALRAAEKINKRNCAEYQVRVAEYDLSKIEPKIICE